VSRAMTTRMLEQDTDHLWLDATGLEAFGQRFPTIAAALAAVDLDPTVEWLPIAPAAHYLSGGLLTDLDGATSLSGLWACGEVACTGVHGANRLASNSLLEGMVFAPRVVEAIDAGRDGPVATGAMAAVLGPDARGIPTMAAVGVGVGFTDSTNGGATSPVDDSAPAVEHRRVDLQQAMTKFAGVVRTGDSLHRANDALRVLGAATPAERALPHPEPPDGLTAEVAELANLATLGRALVASALQREESRGNHWRADHPDLEPALAVRLVHNLP
jgi:L-aspartate oxidase